MKLLIKNGLVIDFQRRDFKKVDILIQDNRISKISKNIKEYFGVSARVKLVEPKAIARSQGKAVRVIDNRKL